MLENASHSKVRGQWDHSKTSKTARIKISLYSLISLKTRTISSRNSKLSIYIKNHFFFFFLCNRNICCRFLYYDGLRIFNWASFLVLFCTVNKFDTWNCEALNIAKLSFRTTWPYYWVYRLILILNQSYYFIESHYTHYSFVVTLYRKFNVPSAFAWLTFWNIWKNFLQNW